MLNKEQVVETFMNMEDAKNASPMMQQELRAGLNEELDEMERMQQVFEGVLAENIAQTKKDGYAHLASFIEQRYADIKTGRVILSPFYLLFNDAFNTEYDEHDRVTSLEVDEENFNEIIGIFAATMNLDDSNIKQEMVDGAFSYVGALNLAGWTEAANRLGDALADVINEIASGNTAAIEQRMSSVKNFGIGSAGYGSLSGMKPKDENASSTGLKPWEVRFKK